MTLIPLQVRGDQGLDANKVNFHQPDAGTTFDLRSTDRGHPGTRPVAAPAGRPRLAAAWASQPVQVTAGVDGWNGAVRRPDAGRVSTSRIIDRFRRDVETDSDLFQELERVCDVSRAAGRVSHDMTQRRNASSAGFGPSCRTPASMRFSPT